VDPVPSGDGAPAAAVVDPHPELTPVQKTLTMIAVLLGMFLAALDQTVVSTAGPAIRDDLGLPTGLYDWLTVSYMVASTVMVPVYGKLSDMHGRKPVLLAGMSIFLVGSLGCAAAGTWQALLVARAVQGLGSAALFTMAFAVVADLYPPAVRGKYTGYFGAVWGISSVVGLPLGGFLTQFLSWHWVFLVNLPIGLVAIGFVVTRMPRLGGGRARALDLPGVLALMVFVVPLLVGLSLGRGGSSEGPGGDASWGDPRVIGLLALAVVGAVGFVMVERRAADPILELSFFRHRIFAWGNAAVFVTGAAFFAGIMFLPLFLTVVVGAGTTSAGMALMPLTLGLVAGNVLSGQAVTRLGRYKPLLIGSLLALIGSYAMMALTLGPGSTVLGVSVKMVVVGIALGPSMPLYTLAIQNSMPPQQVGAVTASTTFARQIGSTVGLAVLGTSFGSVLHDRMAAGGPAALQHAMTAATRSVFWVGVVMAAIALVLTFMVPELPLRRTNR
jgi:EmrB/QacA subfamily drug resistance transporter